ncbi:MAG: hypothetical protein FWF97_04290 [Alphaproteobacteria bacterium]|nr:hypothetical protein [Alphaproteobacteria bacterium]
MKIYTIIPILLLTACNSMYIKPNTMEKGELTFADRGGYSMKRSIKERMEERGYTVRVGKMRTSGTLGEFEGLGAEGDGISIRNIVIPADTKYVVVVNERREWFMPFWCMFNGFWWWNFNVSIADQKTGEELLTWRGRACANSALRMLDGALDELEKK